MARSYKVIENFGDYASWTALTNDTITIADSTARLWGSASLEFDKTNGTDNDATAAVYKEYTGVDVFRDFTPLDRIGAVFYVSSTTNIAYAFVRIGADSSHYVEWRFLDTSMLSGWNVMSLNLGNCYPTSSTAGFALFGDTDPVYIMVGVEFDAETNELADIKFDSVFLAKNERTVS